MTERAVVKLRCKRVQVLRCRFEKRRRHKNTLKVLRVHGGSGKRGRLPKKRGHTSLPHGATQLPHKSLVFAKQGEEIGEGDGVPAPPEL
eukprot:CAMPEP_0119135704 /NCGR_PEP_ID=MMETSP1310-20130426/19852_1 /TAXON_ID=464262 /ORGANISM="Genus nov. species nov., Strain RCC2339" /LENGTH=88 /DNA_ID=CAMNT_0007126617 /DNA_START=314 /DNA_END=580 /DNA_ORIENTATION=-